MAQIHPARYRATDASNAVVSGAGLFVYNTGTSTLATLYSDDPPVTTRANPVESLATGFFPQFYVAANTTYDIQARTTTSVGSALLWEELEIDSLGSEDTGTFYRDYSGNGRLQAVGTGGAIRMEFGPPTGDNIGGAAIISGWAGTDLDSASWKGPLSITGALTVTGNSTFTGTIPADKILASATQATAATHNIALPTGYDTYILEMSYIAPSTSMTVELLFAFDAVPTFKVGADDYAWGLFEQGPTTAVAGAVDDADVRIALFNIGASTSNAPNTAVYRITSATGKESGVAGSHWLNDSAIFGMKAGQTMGMTHTKNYGKATYIQIKASAGTVGFKYVLKGVRDL